MPTFSIDAPNGKSYTIEGENAEGALSALRKHLGDAGSQPTDASAEPADHGLSERQKLSPVQKALSPITSYPETYQRMNQDARDQVSHGVDQVMAPGNGALETAKGVGNVALGAAGFVTSPISAAYRSVIGQPIEDVTGVPREYTEFAAQMATPGLGMSRAPTVVKPLGPGQEVAAAANRLSASGAPVQVPVAVATDSMPLQRAAATARNVPLAGDPLVKAADRTLGQLGTKAGEVAADYGGGTVQGAGDAARTGIKDYITGKSADTSAQFYKRVDDAVDPAIKTDLTATRTAAQGILDRRANAAIADPSGAVKRIEEAVTKPGGLNYDGIKDLRGYVRELKDNPSLLPSDISGKELDSIYNGLTKDLKSSVYNAGGDKAATAFERANKHYALLSDRRESLAKIIGANGDMPVERVFDRLAGMASSSSRADISKLAQARKAIGADDWNEFASGVVQKLGRDVEGKFSPERFLTAYGKISDAGKEVLFRSGGKSNLANHLDDIATVSSRFKELRKFANPSGTSQSVFGGLEGAALMHSPLATIGTVAGARLLATALARSAGAASVAKLSRAQLALATAPTPSRVAAYTIAARNFINTMGAKSISPEDFIRVLQTPAVSRADDQQNVPGPPAQ
jgi:hypothetical protein